ncbi:MAG: type VI secretion system protein, partial [Planctomycetota bacterium]|nr:type VI secretion system protein [Planctomycetota bacterium]
MDAILAEAMGVSGESLPDGRGWERERAYFLKDLFLKKIFRERGLVTTAANTKQFRRRRTAGLLAAGFASALVLAGLTWFGRVQLRDSIGRHKSYWRLVADRYAGPSPAYWPVIAEKGHRGSLGFYYRGADVLTGFDDTITVERFPITCQKMAAADMQIPWVFGIATSMSDLQGHRATALGRLYNAVVLWPLTDAARRTMRDDRHLARWSPQATEALLYLVRVEAIATAGADRLERGHRDPVVDLFPVFDYVLPQDQAGMVPVAQALGPLQETLAWLDTNRQDDSWPSDALEPMHESSQAAIEMGVAAFLNSWPETAGGRDSPWTTVLSLWEGLRLFQDAEARLLAVDDGIESSANRSSATHHRPRLARWRQAMADVRRAKALIDPAVERLGSKLQTQSIATIYAEAKAKAVVASEALFDQLHSNMRLAASGGNEVYARLTQQLGDRQEQVKDQVSQRGQKAIEQLPALAKALLGQPTDQEHRSYALRYRMYDLADAQLTAQGPAVDPLGLSGADRAVHVAVERATRQVDKFSQQVPGEPLFAEAGVSCRFVLEQATHVRRDALVGQAIVNMPNTYDQLIDLVRVRASEMPPLGRPRLPMTAIADGGHHAGEFHPALAAKLSKARQLIQDVSLPTQEQSADAFSPTQLAVAQDGLEEYGRRYWHY